MTVRPVHVLLLLAPLAACTKPNSASIVVAAICYPPSASSCSFGSTCGAQTLGNQIVDLDLTGSLFLPVEVHNQMIDNSDEPSGHPNTNTALVQEVEVSYSAPFAVGSITTNIQQSVPAAGTAVLGLELLNSTSYSQFLTGVGAGGYVEAIANLKLKGILADRSEFETGSYRVPINVCRGCLTGAFVCADPTQTITAACPQIGQWPATIQCGSGTTTYTVGGTITGFQAGGTLSITCTIAGTAVPAVTPTGDGSFTCGSGAAGDAWSMSIATTGQTCVFGSSSTVNAAGTIAVANVAEAIACTP